MCENWGFRVYGVALLYVEANWVFVLFSIDSVFFIESFSPFFRVVSVFGPNWLVS